MLWFLICLTLFFSLFSRSQVQHYILVVQAQDNGHPSLSTTITVYCNVLDLNDNAPIFDPMSYSNEINENIAIGKDVVTVSATDIDSGTPFFFLLPSVLFIHCFSVEFADRWSKISSCRHSTSARMSNGICLFVDFNRQLTYLDFTFADYLLYTFIL